MENWNLVYFNRLSLLLANIVGRLSESLVVYGVLSNGEETNGCLNR